MISFDLIVIEKSFVRNKLKDFIDNSKDILLNKYP